ncbi:hypothetical protein [Deinococcus kurensis]|uniref:hypothetical protein n=1 Tax=Deinococcus kurensis TaxID=2662757 RepID=UPI0012D2B028|nr:hypothetical protein [Deinococcus kurensis]
MDEQDANEVLLNRAMRVMKDYLAAVDQAEAHPVLPFMNDAADVRQRLAAGRSGLLESVGASIATVEGELANVRTLLAHFDQFRDQVPGDRPIN